jgi:hypothetical protein
MRHLGHNRKETQGLHHALGHVLHVRAVFEKHFFLVPQVLYDFCTQLLLGLWIQRHEIEEIRLYADDDDDVLERKKKEIVSPRNRQWCRDRQISL